MNDTREPEASDRARAAGRRVEELEERLRRLRAGEPVTDEDVLLAEQAALGGLQRSAEAHSRAYLAYRRAAERHREAAEALDAGDHPDRAAQHRRMAEVDDASADEQARRTEVDDASVERYERRHPHEGVIDEAPRQ